MQVLNDAILRKHYTESHRGGTATARTEPLRRGLWTYLCCRPALRERLLPQELCRNVGAHCGIAALGV